VAVNVADSSVWIDGLGGHPPTRLVEALQEGSLVFPPLVVAELVSGATIAQHRQMIGEWLQEIPVYQASLAHWIDVGTLRRDLRRKGLTVTLPDAHIAQCALDLDAVLLTRDAVFAQIAQHTRLRLTSAAS
jgi:predicted nucleic acid-binding protein